MRLNLHQRLTVLEDQFEIQEVLGQDFTLTVLSKSSREFQRWSREDQKSNPVTARLSSVIAKAALKSGIRGREIGREELAELLGDEVDKLEFTSEQLEKVFRHQIHETCFLIRGWSGKATHDPETGKPNPCDDENKLFLLEDVALLPKGMKHGEKEYGGWSLGAALIDIVQAACDERLEERDAYLLEAGKVSGATSAGTSDSGPSDPSTAEG